MLSEDLQDKLLERFPWAESKDHNGHGRGYLAPCWCGDGWFQNIWNMFEELEALYVTMDVTNNLQVLEIKEKYAGMRVDIAGVDLSTVLPEVCDIITKYENLSEETCDACGAYGSIREINGWLTVYCDSCFETETDRKPAFRYYDQNKNLYINGCLYDMQTPFSYIDVNGNNRVGKKQAIARGPKFQVIIDPNVNSQMWLNSMRYFDVNGRSHIWGAIGTTIEPLDIMII